MGTNSVPYLGCKLSLVSKSLIRYEGILYTIDTRESTVALAKVKMLGTESRPTERPYAPRDEIYEYIIFRANDIKDLDVIEPAQTAAILPSGLPHDPAIVQHSAPACQSGCAFGQPSGYGYNLPGYQHQGGKLLAYSPFPLISGSQLPGQGSRPGSQLSFRKSPTSDAGVQVSSAEEKTRSNLSDQDSKTKRSEDGRGLTSEDGRQRGPNQVRQNRGRGMRRGRGRGRGGFFRNMEILRFDSEYDFEQANQEFKQLEDKLATLKTEDSTSNIGAAGDHEEEVSYDRTKSFFDNISCEASRVAKGIPRFNWRVERKLNVETFGVPATNSWQRRRRGRGGYRRGGGRGGSTNESETAGIVDAPKTVTFGANKVVVVDDVTDIQKEEIPTVEIVVSEESKDSFVET